jgi:signal transduction histidine kinase
LPEQVHRADYLPSIDLFEKYRYHQHTPPYSVHTSCASGFRGFDQFKGWHQVSQPGNPIGSTIRGHASPKGDTMGSATSSKHLLFNIAMVLGGSCCQTILKNLHNIQSSGLRLMAVVDMQKSVYCSTYAEELGIKVFDDYRDLLAIEPLDLILECTGEEGILTDIISRKRPAVGVLDRVASMRLIEMAKGYAVNPLASALLEASPDGVLVINRRFLITDCNQSPQIPGSANKDDIIGKHCYEVLYQRSSPCKFPSTICVAREALQTGKPARAIYELGESSNTSEFRQVTAYPILDGRGEIAQFVLTIRDITQDLGKKIEERTTALKKDFARLAQEDRLSSLGRLVASVCHEINNPITSIVTFNRLIHSILQSNTGQSGPSDVEMSNAERYLDLSFREAMRCGAIVKNLLTFARPKSVEAKVIAIRELVDTIMLLTKHQLELANIRFEVRFPSDPFTASGDYAQIQQCLLNLVFNAIDAMPNGGTLTISGEIDESADLICLAVADTGCGIDPEDMPRIFEPFYSTKIDGKGSGLGLPMVYGIIHEHHGDVEVESELGKGSTFRIKLPRNLVNGRDGLHVPGKVSTSLQQDQSRAKDLGPLSEGGEASV